MWLDQLCFDVHLWQAHIDSSACVLFGGHIVETFAVCSSERTQCYVSVDAFDWPAFHSHCFLLVSTPAVLTYYGALAYDSSFGVATTPLSLSMPDVVRSVLNFASAFRQVYDYFGDEDHASGPVRGSENHLPAVEILELLTAPAVPVFSPSSSGPPLSSLRLPVLPQTSTVGSSPRVLTIAPAPFGSSVHNFAAACAARNSSAAGLSFAVVPVFVHFDVGPSSSTVTAMARRSSTSLVPASSTFPRPCAVVISGESLPSSTNDSGAWNVVILSSKPAMAKCLRNAAYQELAFAQSDPLKVRDKIDEFCSALDHFHGLFHVSRWS